MGTGVFTSVPAPYVDSGSALLPHARRVDPLHCGGGCIFFDWAPLPGNASASRACATEGYTPCYDHQEILLRQEHHVWDYSECECYRLPSASLHSGDDCSCVWVTCDPTD
jgi:hypothetical protein